MTIMTAAENARLVQNLSDKAFCDAIEIKTLIEVMERRTREIDQRLHNAGAKHAATFVMNSLLTRITLMVAGAYGPVCNEGDKHIRYAFDLLKDPATRAEVAMMGSESELAEAEAKWKICDSDTRLPRIKHFRDKYTAHTSEPNPHLPLPQYDELFPFARETIAVMGKLALATGARTENVDDWDQGNSESAEAFWKPWTE
jgi:hypothetical protein